MQNNEDLLTWKDSSKLPWGLLILFGGGLSIAAQINSTGLGIWIGEGLSILGTVPPIMLIFLFSLIIFLTEITRVMLRQHQHFYQYLVL